MNEDTAEEFVSETTAFIKQNEDWLESTISSVGWTIKDLVTLIEVNKPGYVCCPVNAEHRMPASSLESHLVKCEKDNASYPNVTNVDLNTSLHGTSAVCKLEFDHDVTPESETFGTSAEKASSSQTLAELLKAERDAKRRRAAHRGKRVHSNKKSYNEVMREVISNQMLTLSDTTEKDEDSKSDCKATNEEVVGPNFTYLGVGVPYYRGNPYKRWLTIEQEEKETMAKIQKQSTKREEGDRSQRDSRHENDRRYSRRDYRDDRARYHPSFKHNHDHKKEEWRYGESRKENRDRLEDERHSRHDETRRDRREYRTSDARDQKRHEGKKVADHSFTNRQESRRDEYREDPDPAARSKVVTSSRRDRRDYRILNKKDSKPDELTKVEERSYMGGSESRQDDSRESSDGEEFLSKREQSSRRSKEFGEMEKKPKKEKKKKKKHKHKKKHKKASSSD